MGNCHSGGIVRPRRLGSANAAAVEVEVDKERDEPGSYEAACSADPELRTFDAALRRRANRAISAVASGVEVRSLSLGSLREVTGCLLDMNQEVVRVVLASKRDVWRSPDLFDLVEGYFDGSLHTLDFLAALDASLRRARDSQLLLHLALQRLREGEGDVQEPSAAPAADRYAHALGELRRFKAASDPFTPEFFAAFQAVYREHLAMLGKLRQRKRRLDGRIRSVRAWRRVSGVVFVATFAALLVCSVVAAAIAAPPVATALAAAASLPVGSVGKWVDSLLKQYQDALHGHKEVVSAMQVGTFIAIEDLDAVRVLVDRLEVQVGSMVDCIELAECGEEAVRLGIEEVKKKLEVFMEGVDDLGEQADRCSRDIRRARTVVLQRIINPPN
ncbi:hypothetical protein PAHAL_9G305500 [Panicum hallii]|jgi:hypothetical protein|uniref:Uncharacterized protein n=1 Tax=Panicum hallii TaxID=206008 RepID=A0A2T8I340_9POAL|nr:putative UPF0496 protein 5 [Panicum hallii]PVH32072.1 hypothetical protein PAHAL_9G305500 [Panicum hallii]